MPVRPAPLELLLLGGLVVPVPARLEEVGERRRDVDLVGVGRSARFEEEDRDLRVLGETGGERGAGTAGSDHHVGEDFPVRHDVLLGLGAVAACAGAPGSTLGVTVTWDTVRRGQETDRHGRPPKLLGEDVRFSFCWLVRKQAGARSECLADSDGEVGVVGLAGEWKADMVGRWLGGNLRAGGVLRRWQGAHGKIDGALRFAAFGRSSLEDSASDRSRGSIGAF